MWGSFYTSQEQLLDYATKDNTILLNVNLRKLYMTSSKVQDQVWEILSSNK